MMKRTEGYSRLSQTGRDDSIPAQGRKITKYADENDLHLVVIHNEGERQSGYDDDRVAYQTLRDRIERGLVDAVVVRDVARIGRDFDERMEFLLALRRHEVELHSEERGEIDLSDPYEVAMESIHAASDDEKKRREIERAREAVETRLEDGKWQGAVPFGFKMDDNGDYLVADDDEIDDCLAVLDCRDEDQSIREIADEVDISRRKVERILDRPEWYELAAGGARIGNDGPLAPLAEE